MLYIDLNYWRICLIFHQIWQKISQFLCLQQICPHYLPNISRIPFQYTSKLKLHALEFIIFFTKTNGSPAFLGRLFLGKLSKLKSGNTWETVQIGGCHQKSPKFQRVPKTNKIMTHFHLMRTQKHKMLSIVVLTWPNLPLYRSY